MLWTGVDLDHVTYGVRRTRRTKRTKILPNYSKSFQNHGSSLKVIRVNKKLSNLFNFLIFFLIKTQNWEPTYQIQISLI